MTTPPEPIACTLTPADLTAQSGRWRRLIAEALTERTEIAGGLVLSFRPGVAADLHDLVATERDCCRWATWTLESRPGELVLTVRAAGDGAAALTALFARDQISGPGEPG